MAVGARESTGEQLLREEVRQQHEGLVLQGGYARDGGLEVAALEFSVLPPQEVQQHAIPAPARPHAVE